MDNYLFVYGGRFNRSTKENFDHIQCYLAGKDRAIRAVEVALRVAEDETLQTKEKKYIEWRGNKRPTIFTESELYRKHNFSGERGTLEMRARRIGQKLYAKGEEEWDAFLKVCGRSGVCYRRNFAKSAVEAYGKLELLVDRLMINVKQEYVDAVRSAEPGKLKLPNVNLFGLQVDVKELELWVRKVGKRIDPNERIIGEEQTGAGVASESVGIEREVEEQPRVAKPKSNVVPLGRRFRTQDLFSTEKTRVLTMHEVESESGPPPFDPDRMCWQHHDLALEGRATEYRGANRDERNCIAQTKEGRQCTRELPPSQENKLTKAALTDSRSPNISEGLSQQGQTDQIDGASGNAGSTQEGMRTSSGEDVPVTDVTVCEVEGPLERRPTNDPGQSESLMGPREDLNPDRLCWQHHDLALEGRATEYRGANRDERNCISQTKELRQCTRKPGGKKSAIRIIWSATQEALGL